MSTTICHFFQRGTCTNGHSCRFSHTLGDAGERDRYGDHVTSLPSPSIPTGGGSSKACRFFQQGNCKNGRYCPYAHVLEQPQQLPPTSNEADEFAYDEGLGQVLDQYGDLDEESRAFMDQMFDDGTGGDEDPDQLCDLHIDGQCPLPAEECFYIHGDVCPHCGLAILHPAYPEESAQHVLQCEEQVTVIEQLRQSRSLECGVCYQPVVENGRKFGLLEGCNHAFCVECVRAWRSTTAIDGGGSGSVVRTCPTCRTPSHYIVPCAYLPTTPESKAAVVEEYRARCSSIPCKHFNSGEGNCPFGKSCFYKHRDNGGNPVDPSKIRKTVGADGTIQVIREVTLSDFIVAKTTP